MSEREIKIYDFIIEYGIATESELNLARNLVSGSWEDVLNEVLYIRTGYRDMEQLLECENEEE